MHSFPFKMDLQRKKVSNFNVRQEKVFDGLMKILRFS